MEAITPRHLICTIIVAGCVVASTAHPGAGQQARPSGQEGAQQQDYQNMTSAQRADATRLFLGLGAMPDRAAAARGAPVFAQDCGFCHGQSGRGATGPSLITSEVVLADDHGERLAPFLTIGRPEKGMPAFTAIPNRQLIDIAEFLHLQIESVANRGAYQVLNIVVGNAAQGKEYMQSHCTRCHTDESFAHLAAKFSSPEQLQRYWIWPVRSASMTAHVTTSGGTITGRVTQISDFRITLVNGSGQGLAFNRAPGVDVVIDDPLAAHQQMLMSLANRDMHNVTAYLETLK